MTQAVLTSSEFFVGMGTEQSNINTGFIKRSADRFNLKFDKDSSFRQKKLEILKMFLDGTIYDNLSPFHLEYSGGYVPLAKRRPSVVYPLAKIIVDQSTTMLFGQDHFPVIRGGDGAENTTQFLQYLTRACRLKEVMLLAAKTGSTGSVAIILRVLDGKFYFEVLETQDLVPVFDKMSPDKLSQVTEKKKVDGSTLKSSGYPIAKDNLNKFYFVKRVWDKQREIFYKPYLVEKEDDENFSPQEDSERTVSHDFGFVPIVWIKNLPDINIDGRCTFFPAIDISIEIDSQLSQNGRLLKYNSDPTLVIKNPTSLEDGDLVKSLTMLELDEKGDAYYAEMSGKSCEAVLEFVRMLREFALEAVRGNRASPEKMAHAQSGIGFEMMNMALVALVEEMRLTYGEYGLMSLYKMMLDITEMGEYEINYEGYSPDKNSQAELILDWPEWYPLTSQEKLFEAQAVTTYTTNGILSKETAVKNIADEYNILDVEEEMKAVQKNQQEQNENDIAVANSTKPQYNKNNTGK